MDLGGSRSYALAVLGEYGTRPDIASLWHTVQTKRKNAPKPDTVGHLGMLAKLYLAHSGCALMVLVILHRLEGLPILSSMGLSAGIIYSGPDLNVL